MSSDTCIQWSGHLPAGVKKLGVSLLVAMAWVSVLSAATYCVGPAATGNGSGADWNNLKAWTTSPARGDVWYLMDGDYGSKTFTTAVSGIARITIKKATESDHFTDTGWNSTYGDGQAVIAAPLNFFTGYFTVDGQRRNEADWFDGASYGIVVQSAATYNSPSVKVGGVTSGGGLDVGGVTAHGCELRYVFVNAAVMPSVAVRSYQIDLESGSATAGFVASRCLVRNGNNHFFLRNTSGAVVEYCASELAKNSTENHGEIYNLYFNANAAMIRYNIVRNCYDAGYSENAQGYYAGTAIAAIVTSANCAIYGNLWYNNATTDGAIGWTGTRAGYSVVNLKVYNNTIIGGWGAQGVVLETGSTGCEVFNNVWLGNSPSFAACTHDYNAGASKFNETNGQIIGSTNFVNYTGADYRLARGTAAGTPLPTPYNVDMLGNVRGADGVWDRGAYEFTGTADTTPPAISAVTVSSLTANGAVVAWTTDEVANGVVEYGLTTVYGSAATNSSLVLTRNIALSGLLANTTYQYRLRSTDVAGNTRISSNFTFTTAAADTTPPTVTLNAPANGQTVSNAFTFTATAADNLGVAGVKFFVNGTEVADDTLAPYAYTWDSAAVANGAFNVCAQARDAAGNTAWSVTNSISVNNPPVPLPSAAVYWNFDEGSGVASQDSTASNTFTFRNGATWAGVGKFGNGILLDGVSAYADAPNSAALDLNGNALSVAVWVKLESNGNWPQILAKVMETGAFNPPYFAWHVFGGNVSSTQWRPQFQLVNASGTSVNVNSGVNVNYGEWVHVVSVYDGAALRIYVNGVERGNAAQSGNIMSYSQPLYLGANGLPGEFAKGVIDELRIYPSALTPAQVLSLYNLVPAVGSSRPAPPGTPFIRN